MPITRKSTRKRKPKPQTPPPIERLSYRVREFIQATGLSRSTVQREIYEGKLPVLMVRGCLLIPADVAREYLSPSRGVQRPKEAGTSEKPQAEEAAK
jgi:hypothetical protein